MNAFIKFNKGLVNSPIHVRLWLMLLITTNLVVPLFFLGRLEAQIVVGALLASAILMAILTGLNGFTRILGLGHIFWIPLLFFLWTRLGHVPADNFFGVWLRVVMTLNAISLVIDVVDVIRYIAGEREETVRL